MIIPTQDLSNLEFELVRPQAKLRCRVEVLLSQVWSGLNAARVLVWGGGSAPGHARRFIFSP